MILDWKKIGQDLLEKIRAIKADNNGWEVAKETKDVTCWWKQSNNWKGILYKTEGVIDCDPDTVFRRFSPIAPDSSWDATIKERRTLKTISATMSILKTVSHSVFGGLISSREFICLVVVDITKDYLSTNAESVDYPNSSENESSGVRGTNHPSAFICHRVPDNKKKTLLTVYIQTDLGGRLPQSVVEQSLPSNQLEYFAAIKKTLKDSEH